MKATLCDDCAKPLTVEEIHYYDRRCEACESNWTDRMGKWMRGEIVEPELDQRFSVRQSKGQRDG